MNIYDLFIADLMQFKPMKSAKDSAKELWGGEDVPFLFLCGEIGRTFINSFDLLSANEKTYIFTAIETGIRSEDEELSTAIATGLLEAMLINAEKNPLILSRVDALLGKESKRYLDGWIKWQSS